MCSPPQLLLVLVLCSPPQLDSPSVLGVLVVYWSSFYILYLGVGCMVIANVGWYLCCMVVDMMYYDSYVYCFIVLQYYKSNSYL